MKEITQKEYLKAVEIVERYEYQQDKTIWVSITYNATVHVSVKVPNDWSIETIKEELEHGYFGLRQDDKEDVELGKITELIVNGEHIKL